MTFYLMTIDHYFIYLKFTILLRIQMIANPIRAYHNLLTFKAEPNGWGASAHKIINFEYRNIME